MTINLKLQKITSNLRATSQNNHKKGKIYWYQEINILQTNSLKNKLLIQKIIIMVKRKFVKAISPMTFKKIIN